MSYYQQIFTIGAFALYTFMFSLFIIPTVKNLKQIQHKLRGVVKQRSLLKTSDVFELQRRNDDQTNQIVDILAEYKLEYKEIDKFNNFLIWGAIATFLSVALLFVFNFFSKQNTIDWWSFGTLIIYSIIIGVLIVLAFKTYVPSPKKITEWSYLIEHFGLSPSGLAKCANIKVDYNPKGTSIYIRHNPEEKRPIRIFSNIELRGYKYWFFVYSIDDKKPIFVLTGVINNKANLDELYPDNKDLNGWYINIGDFDVYKFRGQKLKMYFFLFDPLTYGNTGNPYWGYSDFYYEENVLSSTTYNTGLLSNPYINIIYSGIGLNFKDLDWHDIANKRIINDHHKIIKQVFDISWKQIRKVKSKVKIILK